MSEVLIVARTKMKEGHVCIGAHDLEKDFRSLRLTRLHGRKLHLSDEFAIGDIWELEYVEKSDIEPPHIEDVLVTEAAKAREIHPLRSFLFDQFLAQETAVQPWFGSPTTLFGGTLEKTANGRAYVPASGPIPSHSTGYWIPDHPLYKKTFEESIKFHYGSLDTYVFSWVGIEMPPAQISSNALVRVSLARKWAPPSSTAPSGFYAQISGIY